MQILEFYKKLNEIMEQIRLGNIGTANGKIKVQELLSKAKESELEVEINIDEVTDRYDLSKYDDEMSYEEAEESYESSYDEDDE
jgi:hypothetical protein